MTRLAVLIADDNEIVRETLAAVIGSDDSLELVGAACDADEAIELAARHRPAVAVVDVKMPGGGAAAAAGIRRVCPETRILAFTAYADRATVLAMVGAGANGYLVKGASAERILLGIHETHQGLASLSGEIAAEVLDELAGKLEADQAQATARRAPLRRVQRILSEAQLHVELQPIVDLQDGRIAGVEALLRVDATPAEGPDRWFAEAAATGLHFDLEVAALKLALEQRARLPDGVYLSVNLSPAAVLQPDAEALLRAAADRWLVVEITEHAPVDDYESLSRALGPLRGQGVRVAVDDAGSGFASLRHILRLEPDMIKIDVSLTRQIHLDPKRRALAAALITFAEEIGAGVVVEGIETEAELACLRDLGARFGQGYLLGRPVRPDLLDLAHPVPALAGRPPAPHDLTGLREKLALIKLLRTAIAAGQAPTVDQALQIAIDGVCNQTSWPVGHAWLVGDDGKLSSSEIWHVDPQLGLRSFRDEAHGRSLAPGEGLPGRVLASGEAALATSSEEGVAGAQGGAARAAGLAASVAFPISVGPRVLGVLEFSCGAPEVPDHSLLEVLANFGEQIAVVLERLHAREEREQREVQLHQAQQLANLGSWEWSPATGVARFSRELNRILGLPVGRAATDANGHHEAAAFGTLDQLMERVHPDDRAAVGSAIRAAAREGTVRELEYRVLRADGERVVHSRIGSMGGGSGGPVVIGTAQDVTDRRRAERDFAHQMTRLQLILEGITEGVVVADAAGRVVEANPAAVALLGLAHRPGPDSPITLGEETPAFLPDMLTPYPADGLPLLAAVRGQALDGALMYVRPRTGSGQGIWLRVAGRPLVDPDGTPAGGVIIFTEVTGPPQVGDPAPVADPPLRAPQQLPLPEGQDADAG